MLRRILRFREQTALHLCKFVIKRIFTPLFGVSYLKFRAQNVILFVEDVV